MDQYIASGFKKWWYLPFCVYVIPNILMAIFTASFDVLIVDTVPLLLTATTYQIILSVILVIGAFYYIKFIAVKFNRVALNYKPSSPGKILGVIIFVSQALQLIGLLVFDFGRVGGVGTSSNPYVILISYLPSDILFLIYYGHYRKNGVPIYNLGIYLLISIMQGWTGIWLILFLIEFYHQLSVRPFKDAAKKGSIIIVVLLFLYPLINEFKFIIRGGEDFQQRTALESAGELINRLQYVTGVVLISQEQDQIKTALNKNEIMPYYLDNRLGAMFASSNRSANLQKYLTVEFLVDKALNTPGGDEVGWFTNVGIAGWLIVLSPLQIVIYLFFLTVIITLPFLINHYFLKSLYVIPVLQTLTLVYAFHGWFTVQFSFISAVVLYVILYNLLAAKKEQHTEEEMLLPA